MLLVGSSFTQCNSCLPTARGSLPLTRAGIFTEQSTFSDRRSFVRVAAVAQKKTTKTPLHHHKNTTTPLQKHHYKNTITKTPPEEHHHKNITTRTPQKHRHKTTQKHYHRTTTKHSNTKHHYTKNTTKTPPKTSLPAILPQTTPPQKHFQFFTVVQSSLHFTKVTRKLYALSLAIQPVIFCFVDRPTSTFHPAKKSFVADLDCSLLYYLYCKIWYVQSYYMSRSTSCCFFLVFSVVVLVQAPQ